MTTPILLTEIFHSIQGEGVHVGLPTTFIRLTGCSLRCSWCDTTYSFHGGNAGTVEEAVERTRKIAPVKRACVTGGEPLDQPDAAFALMRQLLKDGFEVVLETSGGRPIDGVNDLPHRERLVVSLDVKCPASNMQKRNRWENLPLLRPHDQVKFVLSDRRDYEYAKQVLAERGGDIGTRNLVFQPMWPSPDPVGETRIEGDRADLRNVAEWVLQDGLDVRVGTQMHKAIWGHEKSK